MDFEKLANEFIKQHEGVGYQSQPQMVAVRAFAKWLSENASQQSVHLTGLRLRENQSVLRVRPASNACRWLDQSHERGIMNNRELAIKIVEDLCSKFGVKLGGAAVMAVQNMINTTDAEDSAPSQAESNAETLSTSDGFAVPTRRS